LFEKQEVETTMTKGSFAFRPPELCVANHSGFSKSADIWSMGVVLYCLRIGRLPFEKAESVELYKSIRNDRPDLRLHDDEKAFTDLMVKILEKDPMRRITMKEIRVRTPLLCCSI
jgi:[calcium/calmodulin-dependent protein kinase] kinase